MKKNLKIVAILAAMALTCAFFGCSNENSSDDAEISFADNKVIVKSNLSTSELAGMQEGYKLSSIPGDAKIETISDKTEYKITMSKNGKTIVFYIKKD